jgi:hypothetical protein
VIATGCVTVNLADAEPGTAHHLVAGLPRVPPGVRVLVTVGDLRPDPHLVRLLIEHADHLHVDVHGDEHVVGAWVAALQTGDVLAGVV